MKNKKVRFSLLLLLVFINQTNAQKPGDVTIIDSRHYSQAFGEVRNYRIFLPPDYYSNPNKKYPVIYFNLRVRHEIPETGSQ